MAELLQRVYLSRNNVTEFGVYYIADDNSVSELDLSPVSRITIELEESGEILDSAVDNVSWTQTGKIRINLEDSLLEPGEFNAKVALIDSGHTEGQVIASSESEQRLRLRLVD